MSLTTQIDGLNATLISTGVTTQIDGLSLTYVAEPGGAPVDRFTINSVTVDGDDVVIDFTDSADPLPEGWAVRLYGDVGLTNLLSRRVTEVQSVRFGGSLSGQFWFTITPGVAEVVDPAPEPVDDDSTEGDIAALEAIAASTNAPSQLTGFATSGMTLDPAPEGVTVVDGRVTALDFRDKGLTGQIPIQVINLKRCTYFNYHYNFLEGEIPAHPPSAVYLYFNTSSSIYFGEDPHVTASSGGGDVHPSYNAGNKTNKFTGGIGDWIGECVDLEWFWCNHSRLNGTISPLMANCVKLKGLGLWHNSWSNLEVPNMFAGMTGLTHLSIGHYNSTSTDGNTGSGPRPTFTGQWLSSLEGLNPKFIRIKRTGYSSAFPDLSGWTNINTLQLAGNNFTGNFPQYLLDGTLPDMTYLNLAANDLTGSLPANIPTLSSGGSGLKVLTLPSNDLEGVIPDSLWENNPGIINTDFSLNRFSGSLKKDLTNLNDIRNLRITDDNIEGDWPNFAWGTGSVSSFIRAQMSGNKFLFKNMLWIPTEFNPESKTIFQLYSDHGFSSFLYNSQQNFGQAAQYEFSDSTSLIEVSFSDIVTHPDNVYQWQKSVSGSWQNVTGQTSNVLEIINPVQADEGEYRLRVTNPNITDLTLFSETQTLVYNDGTIE